MAVADHEPVKEYKQVEKKIEAEVLDDGSCL